MKRSHYFYGAILFGIFLYLSFTFFAVSVLNKAPDSGNSVANIQVKSIKDLNFTHSYRLPKLR